MNEPIKKMEQNFSGRFVALKVRIITQLRHSSGINHIKTYTNVQLSTKLFFIPTHRENRIRAVSKSGSETLY